MISWRLIWSKRCVAVLVQMNRLANHPGSSTLARSTCADTATNKPAPTTPTASDTSAARAPSLGRYHLRGRALPDRQNSATRKRYSPQTGFAEVTQQSGARVTKQRRIKILIPPAGLTLTGADFGLTSRTAELADFVSHENDDLSPIPSQHRDEAAASDGCDSCADHRHRTAVRLDIA